LGEVETSGVGGIRSAILERGTVAVVPSSNSIVYGRSVESSEEREEERGNGISMTVPEQSIFETGSIRSTRVLGGYFSSK